MRCLSDQRFTKLDSHELTQECPWRKRGETRGEVHILCSVDCAESLANPVDLLTLLFSNIPVLGILPRDASGPGSKGTSPCMWLDPACPDDVIQALLADSSGSCGELIPRSFSASQKNTTWTWHNVTNLLAINGCNLVNMLLKFCY
uniref:Uncharacterized protein n=1 Tax=Timema shepardi TaxID=629360 RepID=A0A7R9ASP7_TIMSH|nr:unnamed protein product [Timema shepardi]